MNNEPVDMKPFLKNSIFHKVADVLYRYGFQPVQDLVDDFFAKRTAKMVERELRRIEAAEKR
jgi:hypothetical protein